MQRTSLLSFLALASFVALTACKKPKPCGKNNPVDSYPQKFKDFGLVVDGASVCMASDDTIEEELADNGGKGTDALLKLVDKLEAQGFTADPDMGSGGSDALRLHKNLVGVGIYITPVSEGLAGAMIKTFDACPTTEVQIQSSFESNIGALVSELDSKDDESDWCRTLRMVIPVVSSADPSDLHVVPGLAELMKKVAEDPHELIDLLRAAKKEGRTAVTVREPKTFDDPAYDGQREALKTILASPPKVVSLGGKPLGLFAFVGSGIETQQALAWYMWIPPLDSLHVAEPAAPAAAGSGKAKEKASTKGPQGKSS